MPKHMQYITQAIVLLAQDLTDNADALQNKRIAAGDRQISFDDDPPIEKSRIFQGLQITTLDEPYRQPTSRIIVLGHGDIDSTAIMGDGALQLDGKQFAQRMRGWLTSPGFEPSRVQRISLHMCYGGGRRGAASVAGSSNAAGFAKSPLNSFAYEFARHAGELTVDVTARTARVRMNINGPAPFREVGEPDAPRRHKKEGDKFIFTTAVGSTYAAPQDPTVRAAPWTV